MIARYTHWYTDEIGAKREVRKTKERKRLFSILFQSCIFAGYDPFSLHYAPLDERRQHNRRSQLFTGYSRQSIRAPCSFPTESAQDFLNNWIETNIITPENLKLLSKWIENNDSVHSQEKKDSVALTNDSTELEKTIRNQTNKIALLQHLTGLDSLSNALVTLYDTHPGGGSIDQLAKLAGMSKFMLNWNLRKYVKAGIIQTEDNNIYFLK